MKVGERLTPEDLKALPANNWHLIGKERLEHHYWLITIIDKEYQGDQLRELVLRLSAAVEDDQATIILDAETDSHFVVSFLSDNKAEFSIQIER